MNSRAGSRFAEWSERALQLHLQEQEALKRVHITKNLLRPSNTQQQYSPKALEFIQWMNYKGYPDEQVTEAKMVLFITEIQNRPTRKTGRKQQQLAGSSQSDPAPYCARAIGYSVLAAYVNAIIDMWRLQYSMQCNSQFPSRPSTVKELLKRKKTQSHQESEAAFDDIGAGTMVDFVHSDQTIQQIVDCMFGEKTESGLKHRADMLLCLGFSSRGDNIRKLRLPNIGLISFSDEGIWGAKLLRRVWRKSKRNQFGNIEETALMQHREAQRCPFGALALYFFSRWHVGDEPWPDFSNRSTWYPIYVLKGANAVTESTYPKQYAAMNEVYRILGVQSSVKTQLGRKQASTAENKGASASSVDRQGHWATKSRVGAYAKHSVPFDCVRVLAGFGPEPGRYYLPRALLSPSDSLQQKIFPQLETSKAKMLQNGSEIAGESLMDLLQYMRTVILQDAVILLDAKYSHPQLDHPIFASPEFRVFSDQLMQAIKSTPQPEVLLLVMGYT